MCQQPVDQNYLEELLNAISSSIDDAASKATTEIEASEISEIEFSGKDIDARLGSVAEEFEVARLKYNREISSWNEACEFLKRILSIRLLSGTGQKWKRRYWSSLQP